MNVSKQNYSEYCSMLSPLTDAKHPDLECKKYTMSTWNRGRHTVTPPFLKSWWTENPDTQRCPSLGITWLTTNLEGGSSGNGVMVGGRRSLFPSCSGRHGQRRSKHGSVFPQPVALLGGLLRVPASPLSVLGQNGIHLPGEWGDLCTTGHPQEFHWTVSKKKEKQTKNSQVNSSFCSCLSGSASHLIGLANIFNVFVWGESFWGIDDSSEHCSPWSSFPWYFAAAEQR